MDAWSKSIFSMLGCAVFFMSLMVFDRQRSAYWAVACMLFLMFAMISMCLMLLHDEWKTPALHSRPMRWIYNKYRGNKRS